MNRHTIAATVLFALMGCAYARDEHVNMSLDIDKAAFEKTRTTLVEQLNGASDRYSEIRPAQREAVIAALDRISARLAKAASPISEEDQVAIFNDQEIINTIITHAAAESRMYCEREATTGSHRVHIICLSIAKWMEREDTGRTALSDIVNNHRNSFPGAE